MTGEIPAQNGESSLPGIPVQTNDHTGQSKESNAKQIPIPFPVDEQCVNYAIRLGRALGKFAAGNNCQTFADDVLNKCRIDPRLGHPKNWVSGKI
ncbi:hypothetical protein [Sulfurirhabdus autotrophica]|nr:hypothetical protein [Sulfurirhabdus autotrophica]